jgi:hypothetical protein
MKKISYLLAALGRDGRQAMMHHHMHMHHHYHHHMMKKPMMDKKM